jgi:hypothetical protein
MTVTPGGVIMSPSVESLTAEELGVDLSAGLIIAPSTETLSADEPGIDVVPGEATFVPSVEQIQANEPSPTVVPGAIVISPTTETLSATEPPIVLTARVIVDTVHLVGEHVIARTLDGEFVLLGQYAGEFDVDRDLFGNINA